MLYSIHADKLPVAACSGDACSRWRRQVQAIHAKSSRALTSCQCVQPASAQLDFTLPRDVLERKAFVKPRGYAAICVAQDELAKRDDAQRAQNKKAHIAKTRGLLDQQMVERQQQEVCTRSQVMVVVSGVGCGAAAAPAKRCKLDCVHLLLCSPCQSTRVNDCQTSGYRHTPRMPTASRHAQQSTSLLPKSVMICTTATSTGS